MVFLRPSICFFFLFFLELQKSASCDDAPFDLSSLWTALTFMFNSYCHDGLLAVSTSQPCLMRFYPFSLLLYQLRFAKYHTAITFSQPFFLMALTVSLAMELLPYCSPGSHYQHVAWESIFQLLASCLPTRSFSCDRSLKAPPLSPFSCTYSFITISAREADQVIIPEAVSS